MKKIVILVSGSGSNLQRIIDAVASGALLDIRISMVIADRECYGIERAQNHNIPTKLIPRGKQFNDELLKAIPEDTDLIVLAGFLSIIKEPVIEKFKGKIINLHPSLLPKFGGKGMWGMYVHEAVIAAGEKESGATVHYVTAGIDEGEIILQDTCDINEHDTPETLAQKVHAVEYDILPKAIAKHFSELNMKQI